MLDRPMRRLIDPALERLASGATTWRVSANMMTVIGFLLGMAGCVAIAFRHYHWGLVLILANRLADGLDGCIARRTVASDLGGFLDIVLDMIFYSGVPFAFAVADETRLLPACFLIYSFVGTGGSFLAYAVIAAKRGTSSPADEKKSFVYAFGLMEGTETIAFFVLFCWWPSQFSMLAWTFGGLCWLTTAARILGGVIAFNR
jgi:phosphatidylglycerophosphate synthase